MPSDGQSSGIPFPRLPGPSSEEVKCTVVGR